MAAPAQVRKSPAVRRLFELLASQRPAGIRRRDLVSLLHLLIVPADLRAFRFWAGQFSRLAGRVPWIEELEPAERELIYRWVRVCEWLSGLDQHAMSGVACAAFHILPAELSGKPGQLRNPLSGKGLTRHPAYALMFHSAVDELAGQAWSAMTLVYLLAEVRVVKARISLARYSRHNFVKPLLGSPRDAYPASQALRVMTYWPAGHLINVTAPPAGLRRLAEPAGIPDRAVNQFRTWQYFVQRAYGFRPWRVPIERLGLRPKRNDELSREGHIDIGHGRVEIQTALADSDPELRPPISRISRRLEDGDKDPISDGVPDELHDPAAVDLIEVDCVDPRRSAASVALAAIGRQQQTVMLAQDFGWRFDDLTLSEAASLHGRLALGLDKALNEPAPDLNAIAELLTLLVMLWTGSDVETAAALKVVREGVRAPTAQLCIRLFDEPGVINRHEWRREAVMPQYAGQPNLSGDYSRERRATIWLPDLGNVDAFVQRCQALMWPGRRVPSVMGWSVTGPKRAAALAKRLRAVSGADADRWTLAKVERYSLGRLMAASGDITAASLIRGRIEHRANARLFYTLVDLAHLRRIYVDALGPLAVATGADAGWIRDVAAITTHDWAVGARHNLTTDAFRAGINGVIDRLEALAHFEDPEGFIAFHNLYTAYVVWMLGTATALRATTQPLIELSAIDPVLGVASYRDKDTMRPYHARLIWIPPPVVQQLRHYEQHRKRVDGELLVRGIQVPRDPGYYLSSKHKPLELRPSMLVELIKPVLPMPANAHRRYMRTALIESKCSVESVDAMLGHWSIGEEPWARESSFDWQEHLAELQRHVPPILEQLGWKVIESPLVGIGLPRWRAT